MKVFIAFILLVGFTGIAFCGLFAVSHAAKAHESCPVMAVQGMECAQTEDYSAFIASHLESLRGLSRTVFEESSAGIFFVLLSLLLMLPAIAAARARSPVEALSFLPLISPFDDFPQPPRGFMRWLALHEKSPSLI